MARRDPTPDAPPHARSGDMASSLIDGVMRRRVFLAVVAALPFTGTAEAKRLPKPTAAVNADFYSNAY